MKRLFLVCLIVLMSAAFSLAETVTFSWKQPNLSNVKEWNLYWSDTAGGPYDSNVVAKFEYDGTPQPVYQNNTDPKVIGNPGTTVSKYFVLVACGDIPQQDGSLKYECSNDSNEVSYDFWIPVGQFEAPVDFQIVPK